MCEGRRHPPREGRKRHRRAPEKIVELRPAGRVDRDHLAIENRLVEVEHGPELVAESVEAAEVVAVARDEPAAVPLDTKAPKAVILEIKEPAGRTAASSKLG
jgi:hypothetical protein